MNGIITIKINVMITPEKKKYPPTSFFLDSDPYMLTTIKIGLDIINQDTVSQFWVNIVLWLNKTTPVNHQSTYTIDH